MIAKVSRAESFIILKQENVRLRLRQKELTNENFRLELQVKELRHQLWGRKSERSVAPPEGAKTLELFADPAPVSTAIPSVASPRPVKTSSEPSVPRTPKGPRPLDPSLPREMIQVADPAPKDLICPVTGRPMQPGFVEQLEVLARRAPEYYVKRYERTVFVSPAKTAPVYGPWPTDVLPRSRVHASVVAHIAAAHYGLHLPFNRIEEDLARKGVSLPRSCQVSLMEQLDELLRPLVNAAKTDALSDGYLHLDATPVKVSDPARRGGLREADVWAFRAANGTVWFDYQPTKAVRAPDSVLKAANYSGILQTDAAGGLNSIGPPGQITHLACFAHLRRPFFKALALPNAPDLRARPYFDGINRLFRLERLAKHFGLSIEKRQRFRRKHALQLFDSLVAHAREESAFVPPSTHTAEGMRYLLNQHDSLRRCLTVPRAELSNNPVESTIRPLKLGLKNWIMIGHPDAGPRLANLFTMVENCRQLDIDPEAYLIDIIARLPDHPMSRVAELLPRNWKPVATSAVSSSG